MEPRSTSEEILNPAQLNGKTPFIVGTKSRNPMYDHVELLLDIAEKTESIPRAATQLEQVAQVIRRENFPAATQHNFDFNTLQTEFSETIKNGGVTGPISIIRECHKLMFSGIPSDDLALIKLWHNKALTEALQQLNTAQSSRSTTPDSELAAIDAKTSSALMPKDSGNITKTSPSGVADLHQPVLSPIAPMESTKEKSLRIVKQRTHPSQAELIGKLKKNGDYVQALKELNFLFISMPGYQQKNLNMTISLDIIVNGLKNIPDAIQRLFNILQLILDGTISKELITPLFQETCAEIHVQLKTQLLSATESQLKNFAAHYDSLSQQARSTMHNKPSNKDLLTAILTAQLNLALTYQNIKKTLSVNWAEDNAFPQLVYATKAQGNAYNALFKELSETMSQNDLKSFLNVVKREILPPAFIQQQTQPNDGSASAKAKALLNSYSIALKGLPGAASIFLRETYSAAIGEIDCAQWQINSDDNSSQSSKGSEIARPNSTPQTPSPDGVATHKLTPSPSDADSGLSNHACFLRPIKTAAETEVALLPTHKK